MEIIITTQVIKDIISYLGLMFLSGLIAIAIVLTWCKLTKKL